MRVRKLFAFCLLFHFGFGQNSAFFSQNKKIDSLKKVIENSKQDSNLIKTYFRMVTAVALEKNLFLSLEYAQKAHELAKKQNIPRLLINALHLKCQVFGVLAMPDSVIKYAAELAPLANKAGNHKMELWSQLVQTDNYNNKGVYSRALEYALRALKVAEKNGNTEGMAQAHRNIGVCYIYLHDQLSGIKEYNLTRDLYLSLGDTTNANSLNYPLGIAYNNLASTSPTESEKLKNRQTSINYFLADKKIAEKEGDTAGVHYLNNELTDLYLQRNDNKTALRFAREGYEYFKRLKQKEPWANSCNKVLKCLSIMNLSREKLPFLIDLYELSVMTNNRSQQVSAMDNFSNYYVEIGDHVTATKFFQRARQLNDSVFNENFTAQVAEMSKKYETEKKDKEIKAQEAEIKVQQADAKQKSTQRNFFIGGFSLMFLSTFLVLRGYHQKKKANTEISKQKHIVEEKQKEILDSIHYAQRIQRTLLSSKEFLNEHLTESFIYFKPKDIVSGDFYWAANHNDKFFLAVCDSTGHGVPGAFMSLLSIGFLTEAIKEKDIPDPSLVFNYVRRRLVNSIGKDGQQDGFDGILLCVDLKTKAVTYAAANNSPVVISNGELYVLKCDKMPVGKGEKDQSFTLFSAELNKGDTLFCYTDGYADQFGGPKGKKFKYKQLDELLISGAGIPLEQQSETLHQKFMAWKGDLEQVDDVCIIGLKL